MIKTGCLWRHLPVRKKTYKASILNSMQKAGAKPAAQLLKDHRRRNEFLVLRALKAIPFAGRATLLAGRTFLPAERAGPRPNDVLLHAGSKVLFAVGVVSCKASAGPCQGSPARSCKKHCPNCRKLPSISSMEGPLICGPRPVCRKGCPLWAEACSKNAWPCHLIARWHKYPGIFLVEKYKNENILTCRRRASGGGVEEWRDVQGERNEQDEQGNP